MVVLDSYKLLPVDASVSGFEKSICYKGPLFLARLSLLLLCWLVSPFLLHSGYLGEIKVLHIFSLLLELV